MYQFILLLHVFAAIFIIALVLVQQGRGATVGAAFGSGASQTVFGSRGSGSFLFRVTMGLALSFFVTSLCLNYIAARAQKQQSVLTLPLPQRSAQPVGSPVSPTPENGIPGPSPAQTLPIDVPALPVLPTKK